MPSTTVFVELTLCEERALCEITPATADECRGQQIRVPGSGLVEELRDLVERFVRKRVDGRHRGGPRGKPSAPIPPHLDTDVDRITWAASGTNFSRFRDVWESTESVERDKRLEKAKAPARQQARTRRTGAPGLRSELGIPVRYAEGEFAAKRRLKDAVRDQNAAGAQDPSFLSPSTYFVRYVQLDPVKSHLRTSLSSANSPAAPLTPALRKTEQRGG